MKYAVVAMKAYKREEKRLGKIEPKTGCCGMCKGVPSDIPNACQKKADRAARRAVRWDNAKKMALKSMKFTMKTTLQGTVPVPGIGGILDISELGMSALPSLPGLNMDAMKCDYGNCGATMDQLAQELSQLDAESAESDEGEDEDDMNEDDGNDDGEEEDDPEKEKEKDETKETAQNAMEEGAAEETKASDKRELQAMQEKRVSDMSMKEKILDWIRQQMCGQDAVHAAINRLSDETLQSTIKGAEIFLLRQRLFALESHKKLIKNPIEKKEFKDIPRGIKFCANMHNNKNQGQMADAWDVSGFKVIKNELVEKGFLFKQTYVEVILQGPRRGCFCFTWAGVKKTLLFPKNQESTVRRLFEYDLDNSKPYFYDVKKPPMPRKEYNYETAPQQQTMSRESSAPQQQTMS